MNLWQNYLCPTSLSEALLALRDAQAPAVPIAGGTDLLLDLDQGRHTPARTLVDLTSVAELTKVDVRDRTLFIGAAVPLTRVASHPLVAEHAGALADACNLIGGPQVRNVATLGGNVAHALPAADGTIALLALDAMAEVASLSGSRRMPLVELFAGPGQSRVQTASEIIVGFYMPLKQDGEASAFRRVMRPQGVALPILNLAVWICREGDRIAGARISLGPAGPTPQRAVQAEGRLAGQPFTETVCRNVTEAILEEASLRSSPRRASADYRRQLVGPLLSDAVSAAWSRSLQ